MSKITIIGDVHGKTHIYQKRLRQHFEDRRTIQIGDMGIGFKGVGLHEMTPNHKWFRGNHDNPEKCRQHPNYLGDYGYLPEDRLFWLAGAWSIDRAARITGISWWSDEELSIKELGEALHLYEQVKPEYVLSHEAPQEAARYLLGAAASGGSNQGYFFAKMGCIATRTSTALQAMFEIHQPKEWIFGHYHVTMNFMIANAAGKMLRTKFTCVGELAEYTIDTANVEPTCKRCHHLRSDHSIEPPYECNNCGYDCDCTGFAYIKTGE